MVNIHILFLFPVRLGYLLFVELRSPNRPLLHKGGFLTLFNNRIIVQFSQAFTILLHEHCRQFCLFASVFTRIRTRTRASTMTRT